MAFTVAAVSAQAASVPSRMNGSSWNYTAFQMAGYTAAVPSSAPFVAYGTMLNSTYNSTGSGSLLGKLDVYDTGAAATTFKVGDGTNSTDNYWQAGQTFGSGYTARTNSTDNLLALKFANGTSGLYFINNPSQTLFASMGTEVLGKADPSKGAHLGLMVQNLTISNNVTDVAGTWYFYTLEASNASNVYANLGAMVLSSDGNAGSMSYARVNNNGTANATLTDTVTWGAVDDSKAIGINATTAGVLVDKAFLSQDKKIMIGYDVPTAAGVVRTIVALKSGSTFSDSTFTNAGFSSLAISNTNGTGSPVTGASGTTTVGNGTLATFYTDANRAVIAGNGTSFAYNSTMLIDSLVGKTATVGSVTLGGVTQSTMKLTGGSTFVGRTVSDVYAGIVYNSATGAIGLQILTPAPTQVNAPVAASAAEVNTFNTSFTVTGTSGTVQVVAGTDLGASAVTVGTSGTNLGTLVSRFENATSEELKTQYSLGSGATIDRSYPFVNFAVGGIGTGNMTVRKMSFGGNNKLISELPTPTKFYVEAVTTKAGTVHAMNSTKAFTYRNAGAAITDGSYWITPSGFPTLTLNYSDANRLALGSNYDMWFAILDDGDYDLDPTDGQIADPAGFVAGIGGGGSSGSSGDSSGCVLNPAAGFSAELLLLLLAPLAYFIRRKK
jgi:hypothetical protein